MSPKLFSSPELSLVLFFVATPTRFKSPVGTSAGPFEHLGVAARVRDDRPACLGYMGLRHLPTANTARHTEASADHSLASRRQTFALLW